MSDMAPCPSCGMITPDGPHATSAQCIRALEAEIARLSQLLDRAVKGATSGPEPAARRDARNSSTHAAGIAPHVRRK